jgi:hypothetical protein
MGLVAGRMTSALRSTPLDRGGPPAPPRGALASWLVLALAMSFVLVTATLLTPRALEEGRAWFVPTCPTKALLGRDCPTCGMTRAFAALAHGRLTDALGYNRGSPFAFAFIAASGAAGWWQSLRTLRALRRAGSSRRES